MAGCQDSRVDPCQTLVAGGAGTERVEGGWSALLSKGPGTLHTDEIYKLERIIFPLIFNFKHYHKGWPTWRKWIP